MHFAGENPMPNKGTHISLTLSDEDVKGKWGAKIKSDNANKITVAITTPHNCLITKWEFRIDITKTDQDGNKTIVHSKKREHIYTICNPWNKGM